MAITICHFGDWRGRWADLPVADLYICTGNMFSNKYASELTAEDYEARAARENYYQAKEMRKFAPRLFLGNRKAPVIVCRGHRDFVSLAKLFREGPVYTIDQPQQQLVLTVKDDKLGQIPLSVGGMRGARRILGNWSDELSEQEEQAQADKLPLALDILVSNSPAYGLLDSRKMINGLPTHYGLKGLSTYLNAHLASETPKLKLHCFGGYISSFGAMVSENKIMNSCASGGYVLIKFEKNSKASVINLRRDLFKQEGKISF